MYLSRVSQRNRIHSCMKQGEFWIHGMCFKLIKESDLFDKNKKFHSIKKLIILTRFYVKEIFVFPSPPLRTSYDIISPCVWLTENYRESSRWARRRSRRCSARPTRTETARSGMMTRIVRRPRLVHSHWSRTNSARLSLVQSFRMLLRQQSYAIKNQLGHQKTLG